eukprot:INCI14551.1.p1 GENE.INCI14551.1~~INCI14551.1.p1  ORF type:complete len:239 (-),score=19.10 INCI14551.1:341-1057(-)
MAALVQTENPKKLTQDLCATLSSFSSSFSSFPGHLLPPARHQCQLDIAGSSGLTCPRKLWHGRADFQTRGCISLSAFVCCRTVPRAENPDSRNSVFRTSSAHSLSPEPKIAHSACRIRKHQHAPLFVRLVQRLVSQLTPHGRQSFTQCYLPGSLQQPHVLLNNTIPRVLHLHGLVAPLLQVLVCPAIWLLAEPCGTCVADICLEAFLDFFIDCALNDLATVLRICPSVSVHAPVFNTE